MSEHPFLRGEETPKKVIEPENATTLDELITKLTAKRTNGLSGATKLQYIIMNENGQLICMKMVHKMAKQVIAVLRGMIKGDDK